MVGGCTMWLSRDGCDMARIEYEITSVPFEKMARSSEQWQKTNFLGAAKKKSADCASSATVQGIVVRSGLQLQGGSCHVQPIRERHFCRIFDAPDSCILCHPRKSYILQRCPLKQDLFRMKRSLVHLKGWELQGKTFGLSKKVKQCCIGSTPRGCLLLSLATTWPLSHCLISRNSRDYPLLLTKCQAVLAALKRADNSLRKFTRQSSSTEVMSLPTVCMLTYADSSNMSSPLPIQQIHLSATTSPCPCHPLKVCPALMLRLRAASESPTALALLAALVMLTDSDKQFLGVPPIFWFTFSRGSSLSKQDEIILL